MNGEKVKRRVVLRQGRYFVFYVYIIKSINFPKQKYVGFTKDLKDRLKHHNCGASKHTSKYYPWKLVTYLGFDDEEKARKFESYLKSGSGQEFAKKRL